MSSSISTSEYLFPMSEKIIRKMTAVNVSVYEFGPRFQIYQIIISDSYRILGLIII